ncbi:ATP-binding protein [Candidatus Parcubacteria bacterium]|nr:ATP-binding protein [Patescibacteria group bacterium]MBU4309678.1 ATP-binding protein [Patescibacteria group bacterium]MBU4577934.1 ATP-binding protein [Patescibacteria group bacterium]MCG2696557.1 ATP-binding protein [Candidatus Parcubacteria bacterium]
MKINSIQSSLTKESIFIVGYVSSIEGRKVRIRVNKNKNASHLLYNGEILKNVSVGGFIKITKGFVEIIGKVEGEYTQTEKIFDERYNKSENKIVRYLDISLFGHFDGDKFEQGIKEMPLIDNECYLLDKNEFIRLHQFYKKDEKTITLGVLTEEPSQEIKISINKLFASHIGIFGNTGSGKSNTLARIYYELFLQMKDNDNFKNNSKFIIIDFNGEYGKVAQTGLVDEIITKHKKVYSLNTRKEAGEIQLSEKIPLNEKDLIDVELISILANASEKTQKPFIKRAISFYKKVHKTGTIDEGLVYFKNILKNKLVSILQMVTKEKSHTLLDYIKIILDISDGDAITIPSWNSSLNYFMSATNTVNGSRQILKAEIIQTDLYKKIDDYIFPTNAISKLIHFLYLQLIFDIYNDKAQNEHIAPAVNKLKSKQKDIEKVLDTENNQAMFPENINLIIVDLKNTNLEIKKTLPLIIAKKLYDEHKIDFENKSLHIIIDEAHNILSSSSERENENWKDYRLETFEEIIKEGRKFNTFLTISSQRPYDISQTLISQLHNYFIHRLINNYDINAIEKTVSYLDKLSFESIPVLSVGSCFFAGLASNIPTKVSVNLLDKKNQPNSETITLTNIW